MREEVNVSVKRLKNAFDSLKDGCNGARSELERDGVIQRFEFTFELLWKTLKIALEEQGIICKSPKESLSQAFCTGIISNEKIFLSMLEDRNLASHNYNKRISERIFGSIKDSYCPAIEKVVDKFFENN